MATLLGSMLISLGLDSGQFRSGLSQSERELVKFQKQMQRSGAALKELGAKLTIGVTAPLAALGTFSVKAASDVAEMESALDVSFGVMAKSIRDWADETAKAMGRSTHTLRESALAFNELFSKSFDPGKAAEMSKTFATLTQDVASFKNLTDEAAQEKLFSGLVGEAEPLRAIGVLLDDAAVKAKAAEMGLSKVGGELTQQQKVIARAAVIQEQLAKANGDVIRTSGGAANQIRAAKEAFSDLKVAIGSQLLPTIQPLIEGLTGLINSFNSLSPTTRATIVTIGGFAAAMGPAIYAVGVLKSGLTSIAGAIIAAGGTGAALKAATAGMFGFGSAAAGAAAGATGLARGLLFLQGALGPITALAAALGVTYGILSARSSEARQEAERLSAAADANAAQFGRLKSAAGTAGNAVADLSVEEIEAQAATAGLTVETNKLADAHYRAAANARLQQIEEQRLAVAMGARKVVALGKEVRSQSRVSGPGDANRRGTVLSGTAAQFGSLSPEAAKAFLNSDEVKTYRRDKAVLDDLLKAPLLPPEIEAGGAGAASGGSSSGSRSGPSGPDPVEVERQHQAELANIRREELQARIQLADDIYDRADLEEEMLREEFAQRRTAIEQDKDLTKEQRQAQLDALTALYGIEDGLAEENHLIISGNQALYKRLQARELAAEEERIAEQTARDRFDLERDMLGVQASLADTDKERKAIALQLLEIEQRYRRSRLEAVLASEVATKAEKDRARAILSSLPGLEAGERRQAERANETEVERYLRGVNLSADQINQAIDDIKIDGLDALNEGLIDAIKGVKSLGEVFANVANQIISDLLRIAIRKAIIAPLANSLFGGAGGGGQFGGSDHGKGGLAGASLDGLINGRRAMGGPVLAGGAYLVGERGPEIFRPTSPGSIIPNHELRANNSSARQILEIVDTTGLFEFRVGQQIGAAAPSFMEGSSKVTTSKLRRRQTRNLSQA